MGLFDGPKSSDIKNWVCVMERGTDYEIELARTFLASLKIPSNILSKRDRAYSLNIGETSMVYLYVPKEFEKKAREVLSDLDRDLSNEYPDDEDVENSVQ
ncbi:MAG TPA: hypothetical protein VKM36_01335 [Balneolaceae bacterium]|nr:hypothetical protein [Balneolaceae bacterium]